MAQRTIIYLTDKDAIGFRQTRFDDIEVGEVLNDSKIGRHEVFEICDTTDENLKVLNTMMKTLKSWAGGRDITRIEKIAGFKFKTVIGKRVLTPEAREDFINECLDLLT